MANLSINRSNGDKPNAVQPRDWEPMRALRDLFRWDPFAEMMPSWSQDPASFVPAFEVKETIDNFLFKADVPGISEADLDIRLAQNRLTISGKRELEKSDKGETYYTYERAYGFVHSLVHAARWHRRRSREGRAEERRTNARDTEAARAAAEEDLSQ